MNIANYHSTAVCEVKEEDSITNRLIIYQAVSSSFEATGRLITPRVNFDILAMMVDF